MNFADLDAALAAACPSRRKAAQTLRASAVTASAPLLKRVPSIPGAAKRAPASDQLRNEIRRLQRQLSRVQKQNRQLQNAIRFRDAKLSHKELEVEAALQQRASPMAAKLSAEKARARTFRDKLRVLRAEAAGTTAQLDELRRRCRFSQLEELHVQADEFYDEIVRLRATRHTDLVYVVQCVKALQGQLAQRFGSARRSLSKWLQAGDVVVPARSSFEYIVACRRRLLHEPGADALRDRAEFARHWRRACAALGEMAPI